MELIRRIGAVFGARGIPLGAEDRVPPGTVRYAEDAGYEHLPHAAHGSGELAADDLR